VTDHIAGIESSPDTGARGVPRMNSSEDYTDGERDVDGREVWFTTGSQELYGQETLRQMAAQSAKVAAMLDAASSVPVRITRTRCRPGRRDPQGHGGGRRLSDQASPPTASEERYRA
jgi:L-arabinose isomerase